VSNAKVETLLKANIGLAERVRFLEKELKNKGI
jgi:phage tail protein X